MAKLTDQEIIKYYEERKQTLAQELNKIDAVLGALTASGSGTLQGPVKKRKYTRRNPSTKNATNTVARSIPGPETTAKKTRAKKTRTKKTTAATAPSTASGAKVSWDSKIQHALSQLGSETKESIVQFISDKDPSTSPEKINKALTLRLAILLKGGKLKKDAGNNQYRLA